MPIEFWTKGLPGAVLSVLAAIFHRIGTEVSTQQQRRFICIQHKWFLMFMILLSSIKVLKRSAVVPAIYPLVFDPSPRSRMQILEFGTSKITLTTEQL